MKTIRLLTLLLIFLTKTSYSIAQQDNILLINSQSLTDDLYEGIEGSPFYFGKWQHGEVFPRNEKEQVLEVLLNYNSYTQSFEVKKGNQFTSLDENWYYRVVLKAPNDSAVVFATNLLPKKPNLFVKLLYECADFQVVEEVFANILDLKKERYAGTIETRQFHIKSKYYIVKNQEQSIFKLKKKNVLALFPNQKKVLEKHAKKYRLRFNKVSDFITLLNHLEQIKPSSKLPTITFNHD